jgi:hypothetical protein
VREGDIVRGVWSSKETGELSNGDGDERFGYSELRNAILMGNPLVLL